MSARIEKSVSSYYSDKLKKFGTTPQGVDWNSEESQALRFTQLIKVLPQDTASFTVLDWGCGYGALHDFIFSTGLTPRYSGYDLSLEMIDACKAKFKDNPAQWYTEEELISEHDYIIASGIFNVKMEFTNAEWHEYILKTLHTINRLSKRGFSFNILTSYSDNEFMKNNLFYADPCFFFDYCKRNFSKEVALLHDYKLYEFSILVRK